MDYEYLNCRYCGTKILETAPYCHQCGAPNEPEPLPWMASVVNRVKASFQAKTQSVWADRLASLMPLHFVVALVTLFVALSASTISILIIIMSVFSLLAVLVYYPGWYKQEPEKRMDYGLIYFLVLLVYVIVLFL